MGDYGPAAPDPRVESGPFADLMAKMRQCKEARTCSDLRYRQFYFEPNPATVAEWRAAGFYRDSMDCRVVFVCESPSAVGSPNDPTPLRCWTDAGPSIRFREVRERYGFASCYITDSVKCGVRTGSRHRDAETAACAGFLAQELDLLGPLVAVGVGAKAYSILRRHVLPLLERPPVLFEVTHYAAHRDVWGRWEPEFAELKRLLSHLKPREEW